jgi:hypothetical protein
MRFRAGVNGVAGKLRVEYPGAVYLVRNRGESDLEKAEAIVLTELRRRRWIGQDLRELRNAWAWVPPVPGRIRCAGPTAKDNPANI